MEFILIIIHREISRFRPISFSIRSFKFIDLRSKISIKMSSKKEDSQRVENINAMGREGFNVSRLQKKKLRSTRLDNLFIKS